jgi:integrase
MPVKAKELGALAVSNLNKPGCWAVGGVDGLYLQVASGGARCWVLRVMVRGRRREMGLGSFPSVRLADAREAARAYRALAAKGADPIEHRNAAVAAAMAASNSAKSFKWCADAYIAAHEAAWRNVKHGQQWRNTLDTYAMPVIGDLPAAEVTAAHVMQVLSPIWITKNETARRLRSRIELVLDYATVFGYRSGNIANPARWRGHLDKALPDPAKVAPVVHHPAVPVKQMGEFMLKLRASEGMGARALEFAILTAARSGEVRLATWAEMDLDEAVWTIPAARMKAHREHRVPLTAAAVKLLQALPRSKGEPLIFAGLKPKTPLSDMTLTAVLRRLKVDAVPHGFRSSFRDWGRTAGHSRELMELSLAHAVGSKTERAYARDDAFEQRRPIMAAWAVFIGSGSGDKVIALRRREG